MDFGLVFGNIGLVFTIFIAIVIAVALYVPNLLYNLATILRTLVCAALIFRYNPFKKVIFGEQDAFIVFAAAMLILTTAFIIDAAIFNLDKLQTFFNVSY
jgi:hypothetical protein